MIPEATGQLVETLFLLELGKRRTDFLRFARRSMAFDAPLDFEEATSSLSIALQRLGRLREASCRQQGQGNEGNGCTPKSDGHPSRVAHQRTISAPLSHVNNSDIVSWDLAVDRSPGS